MNRPTAVSSPPACRVLRAYARRLALGLVLAALAASCSEDPATARQRYLENGNRFVEQGKLPEAIIEYRNAVQADPRYGEARAKLADAYAKQGNSAAALGEYVRAADLLPDDVTLQLTTGTYLIAVGKLSDAQARAEAVLKRQPDNVAAHILRGNALGGLNSLDTALTEMEEAIRLDPTRGATYAQLGLVEFARGRQGEAEEAFKRATALAPKEVGNHLALANFYWSSGRMPDAEQSLLTALSLDPNHEGANRAMAVFSLATGRLPQAEAYLKKVAEVAKTPSAQFTLAEYYISTRRTREAVAILEPMVAEGRTAVGASERLARAYAVSGDLAKAHTLADEILQKDPKDVPTRLLKGQLQMADGKREEALATVQSAVTTQPNSAAAQFALGKLYAARGDAVGAETAFREVLKLNPSATAAQVELSLLQLSAGASAASLLTAEEAARNDPGNLDARLALVRGLLAARQFDRAQSEIKALLAARPTSAAVHVQDGVLLASRGDVAGARAAFTRAGELEPASLEALAGLLALDLNARDTTAARDRIGKRLADGPVTTEVLLLAGRTYSSTNDLATAEKVLRQAIDLDPTQLSAYSMLGQIYLAQNKLDAARQEFDRLAQRQSKPVGALTMSGIILQAQGNTALARERFERAVALDSRAAVAANNLAYIYTEANEKLDQALRLAQLAAEGLPESAEVLDTLGWTYYRNDLPALALPHLVRSVEMEPKRAVFHYHLGLAYAKAGDTARARQSLMRAIETGQDQPWSSDARRVLAGLPDQPGR